MLNNFMYIIWMMFWGPMFILGLVASFIIVFSLLFFYNHFKKAKKQANLPEETQDVKAISKRHKIEKSVSGYINKYYITFEKYNGDRIELKVREEDFSTIIENDKGMITKQGNLLLSFNRTRDYL